MTDLLSRLRHAVTTPVDPTDPASIDLDLIRDLAAPVDTIITTWFRQKVHGLDRVPDGPALVVGNHNSGVTFLEALGMGAHMYRALGTGSPWHGLAHDAIVQMPAVGPFLVRMGALRAGHDTADKVFGLGRKVVVFPGGNKEAFRPWRDRDRCEFYGRTGFVRLAVRHGVPIVPVAFHGGHSGFFILSRGERFARYSGLRRLVRTDAWPLWVGLPWGVAFGPWFHLPLPVRTEVRFLDPIPTDGVDADDDAALASLGAKVEAAITAALGEMAVGR